MNKRILCLNTNGFRSDQDKKITQFLEFCARNEIDIVILIETNSKWDTVTKEKMERKLKELGRSTIVYFTNSNVYKMTNSDWLSRGIIEIISRKVSSLV